MKKRYLISIVILSYIMLFWWFLSTREYEYPDRELIQKKVNYLDRIIRKPMSDSSEIMSIRSENPEWMLFSLSFATFALTNISFLDSSFKNEAIELIDLAIDKAISDTVYNSFFYGTSPLYPTIDDNGSILYLGHVNLMLGCYRLLSGVGKYDSIHDRLSESLYTRYINAPSMCLPSYTRMIWVPDNTAGLASLSLHSQITGSKYSNAAQRWIEHAKSSFIDAETGLLYSTIDFETGQPIEEPRGSMIGWSIFFLYRVDEEFSKKLYESYKEKMGFNFGLVMVFKERKSSWETNLGDIDSGPLFLGFSIPANAFAMGCAVAHQDLKTARKVQRLISFGSKREEVHANELSYKTRFVDLPISPMAEALVLYMETMTEWKYKQSQQ